MALSAGKNRDTKDGSRSADFTIDSGVEVFHGAYLDFDKSAGEVVLAGTNLADKIFCGIADVHSSYNTTDDVNSITGDGALKVRVDISGVIEREVAVAGLNLQTECGDPVYCSDDDTLTLTRGTNRNACGVVLDGFDPTAGTADVHFFPFIVGMIEPLADLT